MTTPYEKQLGTLTRFFEKQPFKQFYQDLCDLIPVGLTTDAQGTGKTLADLPASATNVQCSCEEISGGDAQIVVDGVTVIATHRICMVPTGAALTAALALTTHDKIKVLARGNKPIRIFEQPVRNEGSFTPVVEFKAILVKEGYRQPGIT